MQRLSTSILIFLAIFLIFSEKCVAEGLEDTRAYEYGSKTKLLQTSDPFLNAYYGVSEDRFNNDFGAEVSEKEKQKMVLRDNGYSFKESEYIRAIESGDKLNVLNFIYAGMPINELKTFDNSPLYYAVRSNQKEVFKLLLDKGSNINTVNKKSQNLLLIAIEQEYDFFLETLMNSKLNLMFVDPNGWSALHYAIQTKNIKTIFMLLEKAPGLLKYKNINGNTPLLLALDMATKKRDRELLVLAKMLVKKEEYPNISNSMGNTALHFATMINHYELAKEILEKGANPSIRNLKGWRPMDFALKFENVDMINLLRFYGSEV